MSFYKVNMSSGFEGVSAYDALTKVAMKRDLGIEVEDNTLVTSSGVFVLSISQI